MPATSKAQARFMRGVASGSIKKSGLSRSKAREYVSGNPTSGLPERKGKSMAFPNAKKATKAGAKKGAKAGAKKAAPFGAKAGAMPFGPGAKAGARKSAKAGAKVGAVKGAKAGAKGKGGLKGKVKKGAKAKGKTAKGMTY